MTESVRQRGSLIRLVFWKDKVETVWRADRGGVSLDSEGTVDRRFWIVQVRV